MDNRAQFKKGDLIERVKDGRLFRVSFVNTKESLFTAPSADGGWSDWGGPIPFADEVEVSRG